MNCLSYFLFAEPNQVSHVEKSLLIVESQVSLSPRRTYHTTHTTVGPWEDSPSAPSALTSTLVTGCRLTHVASCASHSPTPFIYLRCSPLASPSLVIISWPNCSTAFFTSHWHAWHCGACSRHARPILAPFPWAHVPCHPTWEFREERMIR